jgi:hypothetical protein
LPWTPDGVVQRTGRVQRIGAGTAPVSVVFPIMSGTVEERVASMVVARAVTSLRALDSARGVEARNSELGRALGELAGSVTVDEVGGGHARMLAITRELLGCTTARTAVRAVARPGTGSSRRGGGRGHWRGGSGGHRGG